MYSSVNQAQASSSSFSWSSRTLHVITDTSQALALSSCSLLMPCGPAQRLFSVQGKHFHLMKDTCRPTQLYDMNPVTPGRLTCPQVATGKCSVSPEPSNARDCSSKVHNPLLPIAWPCCGTPGPAFILLLGLTLSSMLHPCLSHYWTLPTPESLSNWRTQMAGRLAPQPGPPQSLLLLRNLLTGGHLPCHPE